MSFWKPLKIRYPLSSRLIQLIDASNTRFRSDEALRDSKLLSGREVNELLRAFTCASFFRVSEKGTLAFSFLLFVVLADLQIIRSAEDPSKVWMVAWYVWPTLLLTIASVMVNKRKRFLKAVLLLKGPETLNCLLEMLHPFIFPFESAERTRIWQAVVENLKSAEDLSLLSPHARFRLESKLFHTGLKKHPKAWEKELLALEPKIEASKPPPVRFQQSA